MRTLQSIAIVLLLATSVWPADVTVQTIDWAALYQQSLDVYYGEAIVDYEMLDVPMLVQALQIGRFDIQTGIGLLQARGLGMDKIRDLLRGYGLAVDNVALEYGTVAKKAAILARWKLPPEIADCLGRGTWAAMVHLPVATPAFFVAGKNITPRFIECYENDIEKMSRDLKSAPPKSAILALDYKWKSIETLEFLLLYADRLHSVILLWGVHNAIDQKDFTEAGQIYMQLYALVKCVDPSIFVWKQVCLVSAEDGIFKWLEAVNGPCDGYCVWGPYRLPEQIFADSSFGNWQRALPEAKPIMLGSLFSQDNKQTGYARKTGYNGVIVQEGALAEQFVKQPRKEQPSTVVPTKPPSRWD